MNNTELIDKLESLVDQAGLQVVLDALTEICSKKAEHIEINYQDHKQAEIWRKAGWAIRNFMASKSAEVITGSLI
jgi:hypothetical protein